jgi:hypothetical protein
MQRQDDELLSTYPLLLYVNVTFVSSFTTNGRTK